MVGEKRLAIDIGNSRIKIVNYKVSKKKIKILKSFEINTPENSYKDGEFINMIALKDSILKALKDNKVRTRNAYSCINTTNMITREITIPVTSDANIRGIVNREMEQYLSLELKAYIVEYEVVEKIEDRLLIHIFVIHRDTARNCYELCCDLGLRAVRLDIACTSIKRLIKENIKINEVGINDKSVVLIDLGDYTLSFHGFHLGKLKFTRCIEIGYGRSHGYLTGEKDKYIESCLESDLTKNQCDYSDFETELKEEVQSWGREVERLLNYYMNNLKIDPEFIILLGGNSRIKGIESIFSEIYGTKTVVLETVEVKGKPLKNHEIYFQTLGTAAVKKAKKEINFFKDFNNEKNKNKKFWRYLLLGFLIGGLLSIGPIAYYNFLIGVTQDEISAYKSVLSSRVTMVKEEKLIETVKEKDEIGVLLQEFYDVERFVEDNPGLKLEYLRELLSSVTKSVVVHSFSYDDSRFTMRCSAKSVQNIYDSVKNLKEIGCLEVDFSDISIGETAEEYRVVFQLSGSYLKKVKTND